MNSKTYSTTLIIFLITSFFIAQEALLHLGIHTHSQLYAALEMNWIGKAYSIIFSGLFIYFCPLLTKQNCRLTLTFNDNWLRPCLLITAIYILFNVLINILSPNDWSFSIEKLLFEASMPGIAEEISDRGIILTLLITMFGQHFKSRLWVLAAAIAVSSLIFGFAHVISIGADWQIILDFRNLFFPTFFGIGLALLALRSGTLLVPIVVHNLINLIGLALAA